MRQNLYWMIALLAGCALLGWVAPWADPQPAGPLPSSSPTRLVITEPLPAPSVRSDGAVARDLCEPCGPWVISGSPGPLIYPSPQRVIYHQPYMPHFK